MGLLSLLLVGLFLFSSHIYIHTHTHTHTENQGVTNEHFIVWMRTAGLPSFRKLYGRIDSDLPAGTELNFAINPGVCVCVCVYVCVFR